jgi:hypothetical protein
MIRTSLAALLLVVVPGSAFACGMPMAEHDRMLTSVFDEIDGAALQQLTAADVDAINAQNEQLAQQAVAKRQADATEPTVVDAQR